MGAQQSVFRLSGAGGLSLLQLRFELRQFPVLQLRHLVELADALQLDDLGAHMIDLFFDMRADLHLRFLGFPDVIKVGVFALQGFDFSLKQGQTLARSLVFFLLDRLSLDFKLDQPAVEFVHDLRFGIDFHFDARCRFINQVNGLVRQEPIRDVTMRQFGRGDDGRIGDFNAMVQFVLFLQPAQDGDGRLHRRFINQHLLKTAFQCGVFFDVFAVFVQRGRADTVQFAARQCRLQHVAGIDRTFGFARADHGVQLIDENNGLPGILRDFLQHRLQPLFELAAVLGTGQQ